MSLQRLQNISAQPAVSLLVDAYDEDWTQLWWIRVDGQASIVADPAARSLLMPRLVEKYSTYTNTPPTGPLIVISPQTWTYWSAI